MLFVGRFVLFFLFFGLCISDFIGFGGFVEPSPQLGGKKKLDYSLIKVNLYTLEGNLKDSVECSPNGYYFIPIYEKNSFRLSVDGPDGWSFEPNSVLVSTVEDNQKENEDINFIITGFTLSGEVNPGPNCDDSEGPSGLIITLNPGNKRTFTHNGRYLFENVFPGTYTIQASHPYWTLANKEATVSFEWGNLHVETAFEVSGYDVSGSVVSSTGELITGVDFLLFSSTTKKIDCPPISTVIATDSKEQPLCSARSDEKGEFSFANIPCGNYRLVPYYKETHTMFDVSPKEANFRVSGDSVSISEPFRVIGFSVGGRVINSKGEGIEGVVILVDGVRKAVSDNSGSYKLDGMEEGIYKIEAQKEHFFFEPFAEVKLSPNVPKLGDFIVTSYHLCGKIIIDQPSVDVKVRQAHREIRIEGQLKETRRVDLSGEYCFLVPPGTYKITPSISKEEAEAGLVLKQQHQTITVVSTPILDVNFSQALLKVSGSVRCLESPCDTSISVLLSSINRPYRVTAGLGLVSMTEAGTNKNEDYFIFRDVLPGRYKVSINKESWCWEHDSFNVDVKASEDVINIEFVQTGYLFKCYVSHDINMSHKHESTDTISKVALTKGHNQFCLQKPGVYNLIPESCYKFEKQAYKYNTATPKPLDLHASHFLVNGTIQATIDRSQSALLSSPVILRIKSDEATTNEPTINAKQLYSLQKPEQHTLLVVYEYTYWGSVGEKLEFWPSHPGLLFYPTYRTIAITEPECPPPIPAFISRPGMYFTGKVTPPQPGVQIHVFTKSSDQLVKQVETSVDGTYSAGPLYDDQEYKLTAEKEGYTFTIQRSKSTSSNIHFVSFKLGQITVSVLELQTRQPLQGVLLSLSGEEGYRRNNPTHSNGSVAFSNLFPGQYFLRPMLKEYVFEPATKQIEITEGNDVQVEFFAKRVAFSCYGTVHSLNGEPEKLVPIEAIGPKGEREETQADVKGQYRLRGLMPNSRYLVRVKEKLDHIRIERASPLSVPVNVSDRDITGVDFIVFRRPTKYVITGLVNCSKQWLETLTVELWIQKENQNLIKTIPLGLSPFFEFHSLSNKDEHYQVHVKTTLSPRIYLLETSPVDIEFPANSQHVNVVLSFNATPHSISQDIVHTPFYALLFGILVVLSFFYHKKLIHFGQLVMSRKLFEKQSEAETSFISHAASHKPHTDRSHRKQ